MRHLPAIAAILLIALSVSGCSKCGWLWETGQPGVCKSDTPR